MHDDGHAKTAVVQAQLEAYNARDLPGLLACYAEDARQYAYPGELLGSGHAEIGARMQARFQDPLLRARLLQRSVMGDLVIDHELITRSGPQGPEQVELVAIYELRDGRIRTALFRFGAQR